MNQVLLVWSLHRGMYQAPGDLTGLHGAFPLQLFKFLHISEWFFSTSFLLFLAVVIMDPIDHSLAGSDRTLDLDVHT